jgi:hypothetical protein
MSNNSKTIAAALFMIRVPGAAFARGGGLAPTGQMGARAAAQTRRIYRTAPDSEFSAQPGPPVRR